MPAPTSKSARREPVQARSRKLVGWILDAAIQVYDEHGYAAGTTTRIAERAGVSVGSLYQYFPDKHAILMGLARRHIEEGHALARRLLVEARATPRDLDGLVRLFVTGFLDLHRHNPTLHRLLFEEIPLPSSVRDLLRAFEDDLVTEVAALLTDRPDVRVNDATLTAVIVVTTVEALTHRFVLHDRDRFDEAAWTDEVVALVTRHLRFRGP